MAGLFSQGPTSIRVPINPIKIIVFLPNLQLTLMSIGKSSHVPFTGIC